MDFLLMQPWIYARNLSSLQKQLSLHSPLWVLDVSRQCIRDHQGHIASVSTSPYGLGNQSGSHCTPLGLHRIHSLYGHQAAAGQPFISREPVGTPLPESEWSGGKEDAILSRILWMEGLILGINHRSHERYIYIHGTNQEEKLGTPASHGCIRMANLTLIEWVDRLNGALPYVWIGRLSEKF
jgi:hypothetical protein